MHHIIIFIINMIFTVFFVGKYPITTKLKIYPHENPPESTILHQFAAKKIKNSQEPSLQKFLGTGLAVASERSKLLAS